MSPGSGVIADADRGWVLTSDHVVENADAIRVTLRDNRGFDAEMLRRDPATEIAVPRIDAKNLDVVPVFRTAQRLI